MSNHKVNIFKENDFQDAIALAYELKEPYIDFPNYIPENVCKYAFNEIRFLEAQLTQYGYKLSIKDRSVILQDVGNIRRLVSDERMKDVYRLLNNAFFNDSEDKFEFFISGAYAAKMNYLPFREQLKKSEKLNDEIAKTAEKLAHLLNDIGNTGVRCPLEFFIVNELLNNTDRTDSKDWVWQTLKPNIMALGYHWEKAPLLPELLITLSKSAKSFNPREYGFLHSPIDAAIDSNKSNQKTEYLRAFGALLGGYKIELTPDIMKAIAITATVIINSQDIDVSYDDVRKALI